MGTTIRIRLLSQEWIKLSLNNAIFFLFADGVLDLPALDNLGIYSRDSLCPLGPRWLDKYLVLQQYWGPSEDFLIPKQRLKLAQWGIKIFYRKPLSSNCTADPNFEKCFLKKATERVTISFFKMIDEWMSLLQLYIL